MLLLNKDVVRRSFLMQYRISKLVHASILLIVLLIHLCIFLLLFGQQINSWVNKHVTVSLEQDYTVTHMLSAGATDSTELFQDDASAQAQQDQSTQEHTQPAYSTPPAAPELSTLQEDSWTQSKDILNTNSCAQTTKQPCVRKANGAKRHLTLADISRGFLRSVQQEAGHNRSSACSAKELALQIYASKVWNSIKNAFLVGENRLRLPNAVHARTQLYVTINRAGKLVNIELVYPPQCTELKGIESLLVARAQEVGLFAPFGAQMSGETQRFCFPLLIQGEEGFHSYSLRYGAQ